jgi:hypothetical protein
MRYRGALSAVLCVAALGGAGACLSACSSTPKNMAVLTLRDPFWDRVNVQAVITKSSDCDDRKDGYVETRNFVMRKGKTVKIDAPNGDSICWRHDRNPNTPVAGDWSGWSRATLYPDQTSETDL